MIIESLQPKTHILSPCCHRVSHHEGLKAYFFINFSTSFICTLKKVYMAFKQLQSGAKNTEIACFSAVLCTNTKKGHITASFPLYNHHPITMECTFRFCT